MLLFMVILNNVIKIKRKGKIGNMKYTGRRGWFKILTILILSGIILQNSSIALAKSKKEAEPMTEKEQIILGEGDTAQEYETLSTKVQYNGTSYNCSIPVILWNDVWIAPAKDIFSDILGCHYQYSEEEKNVLITSPDKENSVRFTLNSNHVLVNNEEKVSPSEVTAVTKKDSDKRGIMLPLAFTMEALGFICSVNEEKASDDAVSYYLLDVSFHYLYFITANNFSYDKELYSNMLTGVFLQADTNANQNIIKGITLEAASKNNVKITHNAAGYAVTMQFLNTYNPFGDVTKSIKNGTTKSIKIWETEDRTTCVQVNYNQKKEYTSKITTKGGMVTLSKGSFSMKVILPEKVTYSAITTSDQYWNQKFLITVPGNYVSFYKEHAPVDNSSYITGISVSLTTDKNTKITVSTKGLKGYKLSKGDGYFTVQVGNPKDIYENIVLIDAGHGGKDGGASKNGLKEKNLNLTIAYKLMNEYFEKKNSPVKAYWTRHDDTFVNLYARPTYSAKYQADLFVSLHMNSASSSSANGTEVYYSKVNNSKSFSGITSKLFAQEMLDTLVDTLGTKNRGVKQAGFVVIKKNTVPSILIELGFVTGNSDSKKLKKTTFQKKAAKTIYQGICDVFDTHPTGRE